MGRLAKGADIILSPTAVEAIICAAEDGSVSEPILGRAASDESGRYYELTGSGMQIGISAVMDVDSAPLFDYSTTFHTRR